MKLPELSRLRIVLYPDPILKKRAVEVANCDATIAAIAGRMLELMHEAKGVGLAAPQVGLGLRLFVCNATGEPGDDHVFVNPLLVERSGGAEEEEGCLSIPGATVHVRRATHAILEALDAEGKPIRVASEEFNARVWQHEIDHLDGRLIIDNMSASDEIANRRVIKQLKERYRPVRRR